MSSSVTRRRAGRGGSSTSPETRATSALTLAWRTVKPIGTSRVGATPRPPMTLPTRPRGSSASSTARRTWGRAPRLARETRTGRSGASSRTITSGSAMSWRAR